MSDYKPATRSLFLRLLEKVFFIWVVVVAFSPVCYGFTWKGIEITPSITSTTEYNDNILYAGEYEEEEDVINRVSPGLAIHVPGQRWELELAYTAGFEFFTENPDFNTVSHEGMGRVRIQPLEHIIFKCEDTFYRGEDISKVPIVGLRQTREKYWTNNLTPSLEYTFGPNRVLRLSYGNMMMDFDNPAIPDSREDSFNPVLTYGIGRSTLKLDYTYLRGDYESEFGELDGHAVALGYEYHFNPQTIILANSHFLLRNFTGPTVADYSTYAFLVGIKRNLTPQLSIEAQGGYFRYDPHGTEATGSFTGIFTVTYTSERTTLTLSVDKGYEEIFAAIDNLGFASSWGVTGNLSHALHSFWSVELTGAYREREFEYVIRAERVWTTGAALVFTPVAWFTAEVSYEHTAFDATGQDDDYKVNRVMLTLQLRY